MTVFVPLFTVSVAANEDGEAVAEAARAVGVACRGAGVPDDDVMRIELAVEELLENVRRHAGVASTTSVFSEERTIRIVVEDRGQPFDPWSDVASPRLDAALAARPVGGLGIHLAKSFMDRVGYARLDGRNVVEIVKILGADREADDTTAGSDDHGH